MAGPFFFKWIAEPAPFDASAHAAVDEDVQSFAITHAEGDFPSLSIVIKNPRVGLLSRNYWAWLSWDKNWVQAETHTPDIRPLFLGRLIGIPNSLNKNEVTLDLIARPINYVAQKHALADDMRVLPFWDPVWLSPDTWNDDDAVLEAYSKLWHFDRVTHVVTVSELSAGEDGLQDFLESEIPYDSVAISLAQAPFRVVAVEGAAGWAQKLQGSVDIVKAKTIDTYTGDSLFSNWPKPGVSLGAGYTATTASCLDLRHVSPLQTLTINNEWNNPSDGPHGDGDTMSVRLSQTDVWESARGLKEWQLSSSEAGVGRSHTNMIGLFVPLWTVQCNLSVQCNFNRRRTEVVAFNLIANTQPILTDYDGADVKLLQLTANDVDQVLLAGDTVPPIGNVGRASYFATERGQQSLQYLMALARAELIAASRCVEVSSMITFERAIELTCRMNARINDPRIPGGQAVGKITEYTIIADGPSGSMYGTVKLACTIGYGNPLEPVVGTPSYVDAGYVEEGYQFYDGAFHVWASGDLAYENPTIVGTDDGLRMPLTRGQLVRNETWVNESVDQEDAIKAAITAQLYLNNGISVITTTGGGPVTISPNILHDVMQSYATVYSLELYNPNRSFVNLYPVNVSMLELPKQIDLEFSPP